MAKVSNDMKYSSTLINEENDPFFDRKIENATEGLLPACSKALYKLPHENALTIAKYIISMNTELNLADSYRANTILTLSSLSTFLNHISFKGMTRENILTFLDSFRKPEVSDPLHKWIGTYNLYRIYLLRFFKWLSLAKECYSMKLDLLTNATVVNDAMRFVSSNPNKKSVSDGEEEDKSSSSSQESKEQEPDYNEDKEQLEEKQEEEKGEIPTETINQVF